ncbi:MucBP domain-containing protein [Lactococcus lactis]|uniref:MucBP domain-containing protein n=1 Tax=Lactococcus lactis TaxID=1358 RepID=UPI001CF47FD1|nr:MucBP domain-containing protein [Lactococcus lactis]
MKKIICSFVLGTMIIGTLSPVVRVIAETSSGIPKEISSTEILQGAETSFTQSNSLQTTTNSSISNPTINDEEQEPRQSQENIQKILTTTGFESRFWTQNPVEQLQYVDESQKEQSSNVNGEDNLSIINSESKVNPLNETQNEITKSVNEKSWLATELDDNQAFIDATVTAVNKPESEIQKSDLELIKNLVATGASSIPEKISDYITLGSLYVSDGTVSSIPNGLYSLNKTLTNLGLRNNHFIVLPEKLFDDSFWTGKSNGLTLLLDNNQIVSDVPNNTGVAGMLDFNSRNNMLEYFNKTDYHNNPQGQLMYQGGTPTINVPVGYNFNADTPDTTNLYLYVTNAGYQPLFPEHEFVYYDDGSSSVIQNGVATHSGSGKIWVKSKFSTLTNPFARTQIKVNVESPTVAGDVTAKYVDTDGNKISDDVVKSGNVGDAYTTEQKTIDGYTFKEVQGIATGIFTDQAQTVTYVYTKALVAGGDVTAKYVDTDGNKISDDVVKSGNVGDAYTTEQKIIDGYTFKEVQGSATGTFTDQAQTVTYVYTKTLVAGGDVTAKYVDTDGNKISDDVVKPGNVGDAYTTEQKTIDGYTFKEVQGSATGTFTDKVQTVTYVYTKNNVTPSPKPDDHSDIPESIKDNGNKNESTSENKNILPQTGDNEGLSMIGMISGLFLIFGTIVVILFKRKRQD